MIAAGTSLARPEGVGKPSANFVYVESDEDYFGFVANTSIVEILEGYRTRSAGEALVLGMDPAHGQRELHERVGIVLQQCGVQNDLTVTELLRAWHGGSSSAFASTRSQAW